MPTFADTFTASVDAVLSATAELAEVAASAGELENEALLQSQRSLAQARRNLDTVAARLAGETAVRSTRDAGLTGLAQKEGFRTPEALIRTLTGSTGREAVTLVRVGALLHDAGVEDSTDRAAERPPLSDRPWLILVGAEVAAGRLSIAAAEAIRAGLGVPDAGVQADQLAQAAVVIVAGASGWMPTNSTAGPAPPGTTWTRPASPPASRRSGTAIPASLAQARRDDPLHLGTRP